MKAFKYISLIIFTVLIWTALICFGFMNRYLLKPITSKTTSDAFIEATKEKMEGEFVGNFAMALIENGEISKDFFYSIDQLSASLKFDRS